MAAPSKSRLTLARAAIRPSMWGRVMISGPSGAGKTFTALVIADTLVGEHGDVLVIDTEKESALTYADEFRFNHLAWAPPFDPRELTDTLIAAGRDYDCVIVDSFTHFWRGTGGILDIANGKFTGWNDARPAQVDVVEAVLNADAHVICCVRSKMAHEQVQDGDRWKVVKLGMEPIQDDTFEYEVNVSVELDMQHTIHVSKSRTNAVQVGRTFHAGHAPDFAVIYRDWLAGGEPVAEREQVTNLVDTLNRIEDKGERTRAKGLFVETFGRPEFLLQSRFDDAAKWVADMVLAASGGAVQGAATDGADAAPANDAEPTANGSEATAQRPQEPPEGDSGVTTPAVPVQPATAPAGPLSDDVPTEAEARSALDDARAALERRRGVAAQVANMRVPEVREKLRDADLDSTGPPDVVRDRLVEHLLAVPAQ